MAQWLNSANLTARSDDRHAVFGLIGAIVPVWLSLWIWPAGTVTRPSLRPLGGALLRRACCDGMGDLDLSRASGRVVPHQIPARIITRGPIDLSRTPIDLADVGCWGRHPEPWCPRPPLVLIPLRATILSRRFVALSWVLMKENFGTECDTYAAKIRRWL